MMDGVLLRVGWTPGGCPPDPWATWRMPPHILSGLHEPESKNDGIARNAMSEDGRLDLDASPTLSQAGQVRFRALVDAHFNFVWRYLRALGVPQANTDDATQQVFVIAASKLDAIEEGRERSFLVGTAHGVAANTRRAYERRREVSGESELSLHVAAGLDPEQQTESKEAAEILDRFLASLPEDLRSVFVLFELEGMTMAAISETTGVAPGTVASRLRRAREEFHEMAKRVQAGLTQSHRTEPRATPRPARQRGGS
jgi:RNA polymerase sigma-70 factor, ECF subfamily